MGILDCRNLTKRYGSALALDHVNLELVPGRITGLLGPNGSGKTTLIKLCMALLQPTEGEVLIDGMKPGPYTKSLVSYLPDRDILENWMNVLQLLDFYADFYTDFDTGRAVTMLSSLGIDENMPLRKMSKGTREKVQLIMTMSRRARLYLLDEPIAGVDPAARDYILRTIVSNCDPDAAVLISETVEKMCVGEIGQDLCRYREDVTPETYLENIRGKTAALFGTSCLLGSMEAGCTKEESENFRRLGEDIGIMFQFRDDLMDFVSTEAEEGKDTQKDFRDGIYTLPVLLAAETEEGREALLPFMRKSREGTLSSGEVRQMTGVVLARGVEKAKQEIHRYAKEAIALTEPLAEGAPKAQIRKLIGKLDAV